MASYADRERSPEPRFAFSKHDQGDRRDRRSPSPRRDRYERDDRYGRDGRDGRDGRRDRDADRRRYSPSPERGRRDDKGSRRDDHDSDSGDASSRSPSRSRSPSARDLKGLSSKEIKKLKKQRLKEKERKKREKAALKAKETPEEKIARRLAKKAAKAAAKEKKLQAEREKFAGYTNNDNPFGDNNLDDKFVWVKKREKGIKEGVSIAEQERRAKELARENRLELEKVKKRREEKERELEEMEEEKERIQREKEDELFKAWMEKEEEFHLEQARMRSKIRLQDGRAKPIDILANYLSKAEDDANLDTDVQEPYTILRGLDLEDLEDLHADIKVYEEIDESLDRNFWDDMLIICEHELGVKRREAVLRSSTATAAERRAVETGVNPRVQLEIAKVFKGKTRAQLIELRDSVRDKLASGNPGDVTYWEFMLKELRAEIARAGLRDKHQAILEHKLTLLRQRTGAGASVAEGDAAEGDDIVFDEADLEALGEETEVAVTEVWAPEPDLIPDGADDDEAVKDEKVYTAEEAAARLLAKRQFVLYGAKPASAAGAAAGTSEGSGAESAFLASQKAKGLEKDEEVMAATDEVSVGKPVDYVWREKYRPRKPRYFNRVHTGFEWNKYNQTHYDSDNPPPKIVQGYKFNIFYPDLIDKSKPPTYTITPTEPGFAILRFTAGAPYEDIAFKIVDKPWEMGHRRGFRSQFSHDILQLWFHFRRERYRR
eukprot:m.78403 g.78403  ORF g.78403 m.78403 type:complete len:718 (-) comp9217_c0_seq3:91-2244(-)